MTTFKSFLVAGVLLCLLLFVAAGRSFGSSGKQKFEVTFITNVLQKSEQIELADKHMRIASSTTTSQIVEVSLSMAKYRCGFKKSDSSQAVVKERSWLCYELKATDEKVAYSRFIWTGRPVKGFRLFAETNGKNYLAWVEGSGVYIEEVSHSNDKSSALASFLSKSDRYIVPVTHIVEREQFVGRDAINLDINIVFVGEDESGRLHLVVQAPKTAERFEFVFDDKNWGNTPKMAK